MAACRANMGRPGYLRKRPLVAPPDGAAGQAAPARLIQFDRFVRILVRRVHRPLTVKPANRPFRSIYPAIYLISQDGFTTCLVGHAEMAS
jgi:hypothetical protein